MDYHVGCQENWAGLTMCVGLMGGADFKRRSEKLFKETEQLFWPANLAQIKIFFLNALIDVNMFLLLPCLPSKRKINRSIKQLFYHGNDWAKRGAEDVLGFTSGCHPALTVKRHCSPFFE